jgi:hypothetical protein
MELFIPTSPPPRVLARVNNVKARRVHSKSTGSITRGIYAPRFPSRVTDRPSCYRPNLLSPSRLALDSSLAKNASPWCLTGSSEFLGNAIGSGRVRVSYLYLEPRRIQDPDLPQLALPILFRDISSLAGHCVKHQRSIDPFRLCRGLPDAT